MDIRAKWRSKRFKRVIVFNIQESRRVRNSKKGILKKVYVVVVPKRFPFLTSNKPLHNYRAMPQSIYLDL